MENQIFVGKKLNLLDLTKIYPNNSFYINPTLQEFEQIINEDFDNKKKIILFEANYKIDKNKIIHNLNDVIVLFESEDLLLKFPHTILTDKKLVELISEYLNIENPPQISENIFNNLYQYKILGYLPENYNYYILDDPIKFFRENLFSLNMKNYSDSKKEFLKSVLYRLEYSFKLTGLKGLPIYYIIISKYIK